MSSVPDAAQLKFRDPAAARALGAAIDKVTRDTASCHVKRMNGKPLQRSAIRKGDRVSSVY